MGGKTQVIYCRFSHSLQNGVFEQFSEMAISSIVQF